MSARYSGVWKRSKSSSEAMLGASTTARGPAGAVLGGLLEQPPRPHEVHRKGEALRAHRVTGAESVGAELFAVGECHVHI